MKAGGAQRRLASKASAACAAPGAEGAERIIIIGLTGGIATGRSTVAAQFVACGAKLCSSDALVHALLAPGGAAEKEVAARFPKAMRDGKIDRRALGEIVYTDASALAELEAILHPLVRQEQQNFIAEMQSLGARLVVLEIPLLFETGAEARCDAVAITAVPAFLRVPGRAAGCM